MFFGLNGRTVDEDGQLSGLGVIYYDYACVERFKAEQGDNFSWRKKEEVVDDDDTVTPELRDEGGEIIKTEEGN